MSAENENHQIHTNVYKYTYLQLHDHLLFGHFASEVSSSCYFSWRNIVNFKRMKDILSGSEFMPHPGSYTSVCKYKIFQTLISMKIWVVLVRGLDITLWSCGEYSPL